MTHKNTPFIPEPDVKIDKPGGEGGTSGIAAEALEFDPFAEGSGSTVKIDQPGGEGGTNG